MCGPKIWIVFTEILVWYKINTVDICHALVNIVFFWVKCDLWEIIFLWIEILINFKIKKILIRKITLFVYIFKYIMNLCIKINILRIFRKSIIVKIYIKLVTVEMIDVLRFFMIYLPFSYSFEL